MALGTHARVYVAAAAPTPSYGRGAAFARVAGTSTSQTGYAAPGTHAWIEGEGELRGVGGRGGHGAEASEGAAMWVYWYRKTPGLGGTRLAVGVRIRHLKVPNRRRGHGGRRVGRWSGGGGARSGRVGLPRRPRQPQGAARVQAPLRARCRRCRCTPPSSFAPASPCAATRLIGRIACNGRVSRASAAPGCGPFENKALSVHKRAVAWCVKQRGTTLHARAVPADLCDEETDSPRRGRRC